MKTVATDGVIKVTVGDNAPGEIRVHIADYEGTSGNHITLGIGDTRKLTANLFAAIGVARQQTSRASDEPPGALIWKHNWKCYAPVDSLLAHLSRQTNIELRSKYLYAKGLLYRDREFWKITAYKSGSRQAMATFKAEDVAQIRIYKGNICMYLKSY